MSDINEMEVEEVMKPEFSQDIQIDAYYKGFHTGITMRFPMNGKIPAGKITTAIEALINIGFEPSWNKQTSNEQLNPDPIAEVTRDVIAHPCKDCAEKGIVSDCEYKTGVKKTTGKAWAGWFCKRDKDHVSWEHIKV